MSSDSATVVERTQCACGAELATSDFASSELLRCAACGAIFSLDGTATTPRISRLAIASLLLGLLSVGGGFVTGFFAIACGVFALRRIRENSMRIGGRKLAITGIGLGLVFGFFCGALLVGQIVLFQLFEGGFGVTTDPDRVATARQSMLLHFDTPRGVRPSSSLSLGRTKTVNYRGRATIEHQETSGVGAEVIEQMEQMRDAGFIVDEAEELTIEDTELEQLRVTRALGRASFRPETQMLRYVSMFHDDDRIVSVALFVPLKPDGTPRLTAKEAEKFFASFRRSTGPGGDDRETLR